jgi:hypothetical protein
MSGRREERVATELAITMPGASGVARNVSASGIYFETDAQLAEGSTLNFTVEFEDSPGGPLRAQCVARIVRVERHGEKIGVGAAIESFSFAVVGGQKS